MPHWLRYTITLLVLLAFLWIAGLVKFILLIPASPTTDTAGTDAIVVLTGGSLRLDRGFELLEQNRARKMFISGVEDGITLASLLKSKEYRAFEGHVPEGAVTLGYRARTTVGNADETAQWVAREHIRSIRLVTGNYHMPRSLYELREAMPDIAIFPEPVFPSHFANNAWWQDISSIRLVISEYHKYMASILVHRMLDNTW